MIEGINLSMCAIVICKELAFRLGNLSGLIRVQLAVGIESGDRVVPDVLE